MIVAPRRKGRASRRDRIDAGWYIATGAPQSRQEAYGRAGWSHGESVASRPRKGPSPLASPQPVRTFFSPVRTDNYSRLLGVLIEGLCHTSARVRYGCAEALDHFGGTQAITPLQGLIGDSVPRVRRMALHALSCETCEETPFPEETDLIPALINHTLNDPSISVRRHAAYGLTMRANDPRAGAALAQLRDNEHDPPIRRSLRRLDGAISRGTMQR